MPEDGQTGPGEIGGERREGAEEGREEGKEQERRGWEGQSKGGREGERKGGRRGLLALLRCKVGGQGSAMPLTIFCE